MEKLSKSTIMQKITHAFDHEKSLDFECLWNKNAKVVHVKIDIKEQEVFVDENGVRWVRE